MYFPLIQLKKNSDYKKSRKKSEAKSVRGTDSDLYASICPMVYIFRIFGVAPYEFDENNRLKFSPKNTIFSFLFFLIYTCGMYSVSLKLVHSDNHGKSIFGRIETCKVVSNFSVIMFDLFLTILTRNKFIKIWNALQDYDEAVCQVCYKREERKTCVWVWSIVISNSLLWLSINQLGMIAFNEPLINNVIYLILYAGSSISVTKFSGIVMMLSQRLHHLNEIALKNIPRKKELVFYPGPVIDVTLIERLYEDLMAAGEKLDEIYTWSMMGWIGNLCLHTVSDMYFVFFWILTDQDYFFLINCLLAWLTSSFWQLFLINSACHSASVEANRMGFIIFQWKRRSSFDKSLSNGERLSSVYGLNRQLKFSAAGCFDVNLPLLRAIAFSLSSYLVILLQFE